MFDTSIFHENKYMSEIKQYYLKFKYELRSAE